MEENKEPEAPKEAETVDDSGFTEKDALEMHERVKKVRFEQTMKEGKAGLTAGWVHTYLPTRAQLPPNWWRKDSQIDYAEYLIYAEPVEQPRKKKKTFGSKLKLAKKIVTDSAGTTKDLPDEEETNDANEVPKGNPILLVQVGGYLMDDDKKWLQISVSQNGGYPHFLLIKDVKSRILGPKAFAYMVFPPDSEFSSAGIVMHLFHCLDSESGDGCELPDFTFGLGIV